MDVVIDKGELILATASRLFVEGGLEVPMAEIAREAGVATGSIYNYFRSKDELILAIYRRIGEETSEAVALPVDKTLPHRERLTGYFERYIDFVWADPVRAAMLEYLSNAPVIPRSEAEAIFGPLVVYGKRLVTDAQREGAARAFSPELMNSFVRGAIRNTLKRLRDTESSLSSRQRRSLAEMCWAAIAADA